ncbi:hypothetical protein Mame01_56370 [Microbispora amethystogenes]|nr:hypothetical protein Mame01_56370 [Microbispora amethystogenes]
MAPGRIQVDEQAQLRQEEIEAILSSPLQAQPIVQIDGKPGRGFNERCYLALEEGAPLTAAVRTPASVGEVGDCGWFQMPLLTLPLAQIMRLRQQGIRPSLRTA